jgi:hypothetical protein
MIGSQLGRIGFEPGQKIKTDDHLSVIVGF